MATCICSLLTLDQHHTEMNISIALKTKLCMYALVRLSVPKELGLV